MARKTKNDVAVLFVQRHPEVSTRTLAKLLFNEHPEVFGNYDTARNAVRRCRGELERGVGHGSAKRSHDKRNKPTMPGSLATEWEPYMVPGKRIGILSDLHVPYHDERAVNAAIKFLKEKKIDTLLINGDLADFYSFSRFTKNPALRDPVRDVDSVRAMLEYLRYTFPKAKIIYKFGNHDERWELWVQEKAPEIWGIAALDLGTVLGVEKLGIEVVRNKRRCVIEELSVLHGHELFRGFAPPVNPARGAFVKTTSCTLVGHHHQTSEHSESTMDGRQISCWSTGCLCELRPQYAPINRYNHGFAYVERNGTDWTVDNVKIRNGKIL